MVDIIKTSHKFIEKDISRKRKNRLTKKRKKVSSKLKSKQEYKFIVPWVLEDKKEGSPKNKRQMKYELEHHYF